MTKVVRQSHNQEITKPLLIPPASAGIWADLAESGNSVTTMKLLENGVEASSLLSKILASNVLLQQIHGSGYFSLPDSLLLIQAEVSVSKPALKINESVLSLLK